MAFNFNFDVNEIESELTTEKKGGMKYPALQVDQYAPREGDKIQFCFGTDSFHLLSQEAVNAFDLSMGHIHLPSKPKTDGFIIGNPFQIVPIGIPGECVINKETNRYEKKFPGMQYKENGRSIRRNVSRMLFAVKCGGNLLTNDNDMVQLFTLKLTGMKVSMMRDKLNKIEKEAGEKRGKPGESCLHLCTFQLLAKYHLFEGKDGSSAGVLYDLADDIGLLPPIERTLLAQLAKDPEIVKDLKDPFRLDSGENNNNADPETVEF